MPACFDIYIRTLFKGTDQVMSREFFFYLKQSCTSFNLSGNTSIKKALRQAFFQRCIEKYSFIRNGPSEALSHPYLLPNFWTWRAAIFRTLILIYVHNNLLKHFLKSWFCSWNIISTHFFHHFCCVLVQRKKFHVNIIEKKICRRLIEMCVKNEMKKIKLPIF